MIIDIIDKFKETEKQELIQKITEIEGEDTVIEEFKRKINNLDIFNDETEDELLDALEELQELEPGPERPQEINYNNFFDEFKDEKDTLFNSIIPDENKKNLPTVFMIKSIYQSIINNAYQEIFKKIDEEIKELRIISSETYNEEIRKIVDTNRTEEILKSNIENNLKNITSAEPEAEPEAEPAEERAAETAVNTEYEKIKTEYLQVFYGDNDDLRQFFDEHKDILKKWIL